MKAMERASKPAYAELKRRDPKTWCKAYFEKHSCTDTVENNMSESFNSWIIGERFLPLLDMLQEIHFKLINRMRENRDSMQASEFQICLRIKAKLDLVVTQSRDWRATWDGMRTFVVKNGRTCFTVNLVERICDYRVFDLTGIPCPHAVAATHNRREQQQTYVSKYYSRDAYLESYKNSLGALKSEEFWETHSTEEILPPYIPKKLRGRPKKQRRRETWEGGSRSRSSQVVQRFPSGKKMHCSLCRQPEHRRTKCPNKTPNNIDNQDGGTTVDGGNCGGTNVEGENVGGINVEGENTIGTNVPKKPDVTSRQKLPVRRKE
ncbi:uncharacterized protein LOC141676467 [Apium graveolens]|uniref:uncharacterized protein LOC141676467 n=1 Tax=Apium graveolens TaxID=4045 RepID=UPI003D7AC6B7